MDADGTNVTNLTNTPEFFEGNPTWSPDGTQIVFWSDRLSTEQWTVIFVMDADGSNPRNLTAPGGSYDDYSPEFQPQPQPPSIE